MNKHNQNIITIDTKHDEMLEYFKNIDDVLIPELKTKKENYVSIIKNLKKNDMDKYMDLKDKILEINEEIKKLKKEKKKYYIENSSYVFNYFEEKKKVSNGDNNQNMNVLNSFFKIKSKDTNEDNINSDKYMNSKLTYQKYWKNVNNETLNIKDFVVPSDICSSCNNGELISQDEEGILICNNSSCGKFVTYIIDGSKPNNKEPPNEVSYTAYIRLNHFKEIIAQFQGKETTQIPPEVIENIKLQIKKERISLDDVTNIKTKDILKKLGYNKYYEHIPFIKDKLGIKPPVMSPEFEDTLYNLFMELQAPYSKFCPDDRVNFLNYYYTAYKLCELLGEDQYLEHFPMLKDREKRIDQDNIWKKICEELNWEFKPTV